MEAAPELQAGIDLIDLNKDGSIDKGEIAQRIGVWQSARTGLTSFLCVVTYNGKPLEGAVISYEPAEYLGDNLLPAEGVTNYTGLVSPRIPKELRPSEDSPSGIAYGFYKVKISVKSNGKEQLPARYNEQTTLGHEVGPDDPGVLNGTVYYKLTK